MPARIETARYCLRRMQSLLSDKSLNLRTSPESLVGFDTVDTIPSPITGDICLCFCGDDHFFDELT
jgi:hypothetical protein